MALIRLTVMCLTCDLPPAKKSTIDHINITITFKTDAEFAGSAQQDAHEAFCALLDKCEDVDFQYLRQLGICEVQMNNAQNSVRYSTPFWQSFGGLQ